MKRAGSCINYRIVWRSLVFVPKLHINAALRTHFSLFECLSLHLTITPRVIDIPAVSTIIGKRRALHLPLRRTIHKTPAIGSLHGMASVHECPHLLFHLINDSFAPFAFYSLMGKGVVKLFEEFPHLSAIVIQIRHERI
jgi:hypothetical protein